MPYMQSACVQFSHEQNIYDSAGALFILYRLSFDGSIVRLYCDTGDTCVSIVMPPPIYAILHGAVACKDFFA